MFLLLSKPDGPASSLPRITILERSSALRTAGQNIDVRGAGNAILSHLGVLGEVKSHTTNEAGVQFVDTSNRIWAQIDADTTGETSTPTADIEILRGRFAEILVRKMREVSGNVSAQGGYGVEEIWGDYLETIDQDDWKVRVTFAKSREQREYDLVVGADGLQSSTRSLAWGAKNSQEQIKRLGMYAAFFSIPRGKTDTDYRRWFHASGRRGVMLRPDDTGKKTTVFMYVINEQDERLSKLAGRDNIESQKSMMAEYFADAGWESKRVIEEMHLTNDFYYDMVGQVKTDSYTKGRVTLVGDAG